jgi:type II secretory pathway pseudopilin PulG
MRTGEVVSRPSRGQRRPGAAGTPGRASARQGGFTLAALIVVLAVMAIFLTVAVESVSFQKRRENEEELVFRGNQFVEAVRLFRARNGRFPLSLDELYRANPKVMRKKWLDPITGKLDWKPLFLGQEGSQVGPGATTPGASTTPTPGHSFWPTPTPGPGGQGGQQGGPIVGVACPSCEDSIRVLDGRTRYCDWKFVFDPNKQKVPGVVPTGQAQQTPRPGK